MNEHAETVDLLATENDLTDIRSNILTRLTPLEQNTNQSTTQVAYGDMHPDECISIIDSYLDNGVSSVDEQVITDLYETMLEDRADDNWRKTLHYYTLGITDDQDAARQAQENLRESHHVESLIIRYPREHTVTM